MNIVQLLTWLDDRGIQVDRRGDRLLVRSLHGSVDDEVRSLLREHKAALLAEIDRGGADAPASAGQQQLWLIDQVEGGGHAYNATAVLRVKGPVDDAALDAAFTKLVQRNEVFRTSLVLRAGELRQRVRPAGPVTVDRVDLEGLPGDTAETRIRQIADTSARTPFDLADDVLVRATRIRTGDGDTVLVVTLHHVAGDGLSMALLHAEIAELYDAAVSDREPELPPQPGQYRDYARRRRQSATDDRERPGDGEPADQFWVRYLDGAPSTVLPLDRPRPAKRTFAGDCVRFRLDTELVARLRDLASGRATTLFVVLLAVLGDLLGRHGGQEDVVIATPVVDRPERRFEKMIGYFLNTVAIRCDLSGGPGFGALVDRVRDSTRAALAHASTPFEEVVRAVGASRGGTHSPVYQVMFALQTGQPSRPFLSGNEVEEIPYDPPTAKHDLTIMLDEDGDGLLGRLEYSTDVLDRETACLLADHLVTLAHALVADPSRPLAAIPLATDVERTRLAEREDALSLRIVDSEGARVPLGVVGRLVLDDGVSPGRQLARHARWRPRGGVEVLDDPPTQPGPNAFRAPGTSAAHAGPDAPATPATSTLVAAIWADVIGRTPAGDEDFFALGGTSMALMQVNWELRRRAGVEVPIAELLAVPTVSGMAGTVAQHQERTGREGHTSRWTRTELPLRGPGHLFNVAALSPTQMWAAGVRETPGSAEGTRSVVLRWNGDSWHEVPHPELEKVFGVAVAPSGAVWLSGRRGLLCFEGTRFRRVGGDAPQYDCASITRIGDGLWTMVRPDDTPGAQTYVAAGGEDGRWRRLPLPLPPRATTRFGCLAGTSDRDVWAAVVVDGDDASRESWLAHWDGQRWQEVVPPPLGRAGVEIMRVVPHGPDDVWVLGARLTAEGRVSVMVRWDGHEWTEPTLPAGHRGRINSLTAAGDGTLWAVGGGQGDAGVVLRSNDGGRHWEPDVAPSSVLLGDIVPFPDGDGLIVGGAADDGLALFRREGVA
ncbi:condensation domain-containing protein [Streptomyces sp. AC555_RSS877]|uniref:condensation domain-containing protein n=1 Tax=Streptomyces sp. AC555_RSS877 TaxID=2823688 RepID=UPI001C264A7D|nr:condensation domain-containing protein [Streptomyces sp. AC555_RSS877]